MMKIVAIGVLCLLTVQVLFSSAIVGVQASDWPSLPPLPELPPIDIPELPPIDIPPIDIPPIDIPPIDIPPIDIPPIELPPITWPSLPDTDPIAESIRAIQESAETDWCAALRMADQLTSAYREDVKAALYLEAKRELCAEYNDPSKVGELDKRRNLPTEVAIVAVKLLPIYDPEKREVRTFDAFSRDLVSSDPAVKGSDLAKDPVRFGVLLMLDSDYLTRAQIIRTPDGRWISITEAEAESYKTGEVAQAKADYEHARASYANRDSAQLEKYLQSFSSKITSINQSGFQFDPMWTIPIILVIALAICLIAVHNKHTHKKRD